MTTETANEPATSAPWAPYSAFAHLIGEGGIKLSRADYDFAARCVNAHADLVAALLEAADDEEFAASVAMIDTAEKRHRAKAARYRAAIAKATGGAA